MVSVFCDKILNVLRKANFTFPWVLLLYNQSSSRVLWLFGQWVSAWRDCMIIESNNFLGVVAGITIKP